MGFDGFFLNSNNGKKIRLEDLQNLKSSEVAQNTEIQKIFNIFDTDKNGELETKNVRGDNELKSLFQSLLQASGEDGVLQDSEIDHWLKSDNKFNGVSVNNFKSFVQSLIPTLQVSGVKEVSAVERTNLLEGVSYSTGGMLFENDEIAQEYFLNDFYEYYEQAYSIYAEINLGAIGQALDVDANDSGANLTRARLRETLEVTEANYNYMRRAKDGQITKYEYYKESREHLKEIIKTHIRLNRKFIESKIKSYYEDSVKGDTFWGYSSNRTNSQGLRFFDRDSHSSLEFAGELSFLLHHHS